MARYPEEVQHIGARTVGRPIYIKFNKRGREVYAILLQFSVTASADEKPGSDMDTFIGYEVRPSAVPNPQEVRKHPAQLAPGKRHCFFVKVDGNEFQIVTLRR
ncbi:MAG: hypothetical protein WD403_11510 [Pirellulales bacterium]